VILLLANAKGGVGKTAIATNLATWLANNRKENVALVDLDPNKNSSNWGIYRNNNPDISQDIGQIEVFNFAKDTDAYDKIVELSNKFKFVILDMGGHDSEIARKCLIIADEIVVPLRPNQGDIDVTSDLLEVIEEANGIRESVDLDPVLPYVYFTQVNANPRVPALREAVSDFQNASGTAWETIATTASYFRQAYPAAYKSGLGVIEVKIGASKAANDINELAEIIFKGH
jgi:chromosome partitioning protein